MVKVGDRVETTGYCSGYFPIGATGTIVACDSSLYYVAFDPHTEVNPGNGRQWWVDRVNVKPAQCVPVMARANDPATSKGKRKVNKYEQAVINTLKGLYKDQGYTGKQIASLTGHPLNCITPRFAPLRRKGLIKDSGSKRDKQIVWVLV